MAAERPGPVLERGRSVRREEGCVRSEHPKSPSRAPQQSVRFHTTTELTVAEAPKSTCHQAFRSRFVAVTDPSGKIPSVLPSTADAATAVAIPGKVLLSVAIFRIARLESVVALPNPNTWTSARLR